jgi:uncharacterized protein YndB with AHSA1/START domain
MSEEFGVVREDGDLLSLRFERRYAATPEEVWAAMTEPDSIQRWLFAAAVLEPRVGGEFRLDWSDTEKATGSVLVWDPPSVLEVEWNEPNVSSTLQLRIESSRAGTLLTLDQRNISVQAAIGMGAGWHAHLDALGDLVEGRGADEEAWRPRFDALRPQYDELVRAAAT